MPECSFCAAPARTFQAKAHCALCPRVICDTCDQPLCVACYRAVFPQIVAHALRLRATCVLLEGQGAGALQGLHEELVDMVTRDYTRWRLRRPEAPLEEWLRLCDARLASMDRAPMDLRCETRTILRWLATAPPQGPDNLVHPQTPSPALPSGRVRPVLWVPTLVDGARLANPRVCGGCLYHPKGGPAAVPRTEPPAPKRVWDCEEWRANVEAAVELSRTSNDPAEEQAAVRQRQRIAEEWALVQENRRLGAALNTRPSLHL